MRRFNAVRARFTLVLVFTCALCSVCRSEEPVEVTVCELLANPDAYDHKLVEVSGQVTFGFEEFTLTSKNCPGKRGSGGNWLDYGGMMKSGAIPQGWTRRRDSALVVDGIATSLVEDSRFSSFDTSLHKASGAALSATLEGRYFAGKSGASGVPEWRGFGMWGMFSLLVIQQVLHPGAK